jgi:hypothetical protein
VPSMIMVVLPTLDQCHQMLHAWQAAGVPGGTLLDSIGLFEANQRIGRDDLPLFPSLRKLTEQESFQHTLFAIVGDEADLDQIIAASEKVVGSFDEPNSGILFVVPVTHVRGLKHWS